ncbi:hypothetical protein PT2222_220125 [Paraburkholderia tropica]
MMASGALRLCGMQRSEIEEHGFAFALHDDVEVIDDLARLFAASRDQRVATRRRHRRQHRIGRVGRRFVVEIHAREGMREHAAHHHDHVQMRRLAGVLDARLHGAHDEALFRIRAGAHAREAAETRFGDLLARRRITAAGVDLRELQHRVEDRLAVAVDHAADQRNVLAGRLRADDVGGEQALEIEVVLLWAEAVGEVRANGLRGRFLECHDQRSIGVSLGPRSTMSNS